MEHNIDLNKRNMRSNFLQKFIFSTISKYFKVFVRFPLPSIFSLLFCILTIVINHNRDIDLLGYIQILFLGCFWFISLNLYAENNKLFKRFQYFIGLSIFFIIAYLCGGIKIYNIILNKKLDFLFLGSGLFISMFITPFIFQKNNNETFIRFVYSLTLHILFTILVAGILYLSIISIMYALRSLFNIKFYFNYFDIFLITASFLSPMIAMAGIPQDYSLKLEDFSKKLRFTLLYIILPSVLIYVAIVYAYFIKILILQTLPKGIISKMFLGVGCTGIACYLISYPLRDSNRIFSFFHNNFFRIILMPLCLASYALFLRIYNYGFTEYRYLLCLCFFWFLLSALFVLIKGHKDAPKFLVCTLAFLLIFSSFGPWRASKISEYSQIYRLQNILKNNGMLVNNKIKPIDSELNSVQNYEICNIVNYFKENPQALVEWLSNNGFDNLNQQKDSNDILKEVGLNCPQYGRTKPYFSFENNKIRSEAIKITNYDYYITVNNLDSSKMYYLDSPKNIFIKVLLDDKNKDIQIIFSNRKDPIKVNINILLDKILNKSFTQEDMIFYGKEDKIEWKLVINMVAGFIENPNIKAILLIKNPYNL